MNKTPVFVATLIAAIVIAFLAGRIFNDSSGMSGSSPGDGDREILYWVAPMDPNFRRDEPGKSPMGMDLVPVYADEVDGQPGTVNIDPTVVNNLGVRTASSDFGSLSRLIVTVG